MKGDELREAMERFWKNTFSVIYPEKINMTRRAVMKQILAQHLINNILVDLRMHTESRTVKVISGLLGKETESSGESRTKGQLKAKAKKIPRSLFQGRYDDLPANVMQAILPLLPNDVEKCLSYDLKKNSEKYVPFALKLCKLDIAEGGMCFMPTRRSCVPCHVKLDMECLGELLIPWKERTKQRKEASDREAYNNWVWNIILDRRKVNRKLSRSGFRFHHEISTDGVSASILYSKAVPRSSSSSASKNETKKRN